MMSFYIKRILHPLFMFQVHHLPKFADYAYEWALNLQRLVHGKLLQPDYIAQFREAISTDKE